MSHTPGPWVVEDDGRKAKGRRKAIAPSMVMVVAENGGMPGILVSQGVVEERDFANARLIVAAPDMLAALKSYETLDGPEWNEIRKAAIAKAEGK